MSAPTQWPPMAGVGRRSAMFWSTAKTVTSTSSPDTASVKVRVAPSGCGADGPALVVVVAARVVVSAEGSLLLEHPESMREMATPNVTRSVRMRIVYQSFPARSGGSRPCTWCGTAGGTTAKPAWPDVPRWSATSPNLRRYVAKKSDSDGSYEVEQPRRRRTACAQPRAGSCWTCAAETVRPSRESRSQ